MPEIDAGLLHRANHTPAETSLVDEFAQAFGESPLPLESRLLNFPRHVRRQEVSRFLAKWELFKLALPNQGSVVECGVYAGAGLFSWLHFSSILEPYNHQRRIFGFDTFSGFPDLAPQDTAHGKSEHLKKGGFPTGPEVEREVDRLISLHDRNRPVGHIPKAQLVVGDAVETIPEFVAEHPHLLVSLLYLDFDLYEPTKAALTQLYPRVVKGGIVAFDELNCAEFPGETVALLETLGLGGLKIQRFAFDPYISYLVKD